MAKIIECPTCGLQYDEEIMDKCPFCELDKGNLDGNQVGNVFNKYFQTQSQSVKHEKTQKSNLDNSPRPVSTYEPSLSIWWTIATIIMILSGVGLFVLTFVSIAEKNAIYFIAGFGEFIVILLFCGIIQLLAKIKFGIDKLQNKE